MRRTLRASRQRGEGRAEACAFTLFSRFLVIRACGQINIIVGVVRRRARRSRVRNNTFTSRYTCAIHAAKAIVVRCDIGRGSRRGRSTPTSTKIRISAPGLPRLPVPLYLCPVLAHKPDFRPLAPERTRSRGSRVFSHAYRYTCTPVIAVRTAATARAASPPPPLRLERSRDYVQVCRTGSPNLGRA